MDKNAMQTLDQSESKRHLASIQMIKDIQPIKNADRIVLATIEGWKAVVGKNDFNVGDKAVYFEIDSFLPDEDKYAFLGPATYNRWMDISGHRIRTMKLRGQISQGLLMPISKFSELTGSEPVGKDVTELLHVEKWYKPESMGAFGKRLADFPTQFIEKSDEVRLQSNMHYIKDLMNRPYYISVKIDGTSITLVKHNDEVMLATRNQTLDPKDSILWNELLPVIEKLKQCPYADVALQGEYYGEQIQKNRLGIHGHKWAIYTVAIDGVRQGLLKSLTFTRSLGLDFVPIMEVGDNNVEDLPEFEKLGVKHTTNMNFSYTLEDLLAKADDKYPNGHNQEGIVIRNLYPLDEPIYVETNVNTNERIYEKYISFKVLNNKFLLKED